MGKSPFFRSLFFLVIVLASSSSLVAQNSLERISNVERSDGKGYVIRYHFTQPVDSFLIIQPAPDLIQMVFYDDNIDTTGMEYPEQGDQLRGIQLYNLDYGYGADIYLTDSSYYKSDAYPDQSSNHLLLALTEASEYEVKEYSQQFLARNWYEEITPEDALEVEGIPAAATNSYETVKNKLKFDKVVIDAGHGDWDPGSIGYRGTKEKNITLDIAKKLGDYIEENLPDVDVVYTRTDDTYLGLSELGHVANVSEGDLFVSIHCNSFPQNQHVRGTEVYFLGLHKSEASFEVMKRENSVFKDEAKKELSEEDLMIYELAHSGYIATSEKIAAMIDHQFKNRAQRKSRGVKQAGFQVLFEAAMPAVLVETGFLTNPAEERFLRSEYGQAIIASAIYRAIRDYKAEYEQSQAYNSTN